jgi:hypothetical protein
MVGTPTPDCIQGDNWLVWIDSKRARPQVEGFHPRPFGCKVGSQFHHRPRFSEPPISSRTVGFPESGWRPWPLAAVAPSLERRGLSAGPHPPRARQVYAIARHRRDRYRGDQALCPAPLSRRCPPSAESPFAPSRCYLSGGGLLYHLEGRYPFVIAPTGSCASPKSSTRLHSRYSAWSVQVAASPCWKRDLPDVISASLSLDAWTCISPACESARARFFLPQHRPSPPGTWVGLAGKARSATSERPSVSRRQSFRDVQASKFACHPGRSYRCGFRIRKAAVVYTSEQNACCYLHAHRIC